MSTATIDLRALVRAAWPESDQARVLAYLRRYGPNGKLTMQRHLGMDRERMAAAVDGLRSRGLVEKLPPLPGTYWPQWRARD